MLKKISNHLKKIVPLMKIHNKLIKSKQVAENTDLCGNFIHYNFDQNGPPYFPTTETNNPVIFRLE